MFAFGLKGRTAEVIRRGGHAVFLGDFIDVDGINTSELNDEAKAALYFYAVANCLYDLYLQMKLSRCGDAPWADFGFFMEKACDGIERYEKSRGIVRGGMASQALPLLVLGHALVACDRLLADFRR
jgi:hypothetical protein